MARFYGNVGYADTQEIRPGVWEDVIEERSYYGTVTRDSTKWRNSEGLHDNLTMVNTISIVADAYAIDHVFDMRYIEWLGKAWRITDVVVERPRLEIRLGGVYNGPRPSTP